MELFEQDKKVWDECNKEIIKQKNLEIETLSNKLEDTENLLHWIVSVDGNTCLKYKEILKQQLNHKGCKARL